MASADVIRRLLLKYFKEAPKEVIIDHLEVMYTSLSAAQKAALIALAKAYLIVQAEKELESAIQAYDSFQVQLLATEEIISKIKTDAQTLIDEVNSL